MSPQFLRTHSLTSLGTTNLHDLLARGFVTKEVVKSCHAMDFGTGQIQLLRDVTDRLRRDVTHRLLNIVKNWQQGPVHMFFGGKQILNGMVCRFSQHIDQPRSP
jgi:hypothetical protein